MNRLSKPFRWARTKLRQVPYEVRAQVYRGATALSASLVAGGTFTEGTAQVVLFVLASLLGVGAGAVAASNTPTYRSQVREWHHTIQQGR